LRYDVSISVGWEVVLRATTRTSSFATDWSPLSLVGGTVRLGSQAVCADGYVTQRSKVRVLLRGAEMATATARMEAVPCVAEIQRTVPSGGWNARDGDGGDRRNLGQARQRNVHGDSRKYRRQGSEVMQQCCYKLFT
jgi:hypothetical protein